MDCNGVLRWLVMGCFVVRLVFCLGLFCEALGASAYCFYCSLDVVVAHCRGVVEVVSGEEHPDRSGLVCDGDGHAFFVPGVSPLRVFHFECEVFFGVWAL